MSDKIAVQCKNINKSFIIAENVETIALRGVDLEVYKDEFFMLVGPLDVAKQHSFPLLRVFFNQIMAAVL